MSQPLVIPASDLNALKLAGFTQPTPGKSTKVPRISAATQGRTKMGKSHWAVMTTPDPVAYVMLDPGCLQIADKAAAQGKRVLPKFIEHSKKEDQDTAKKLWQEYRKAIRAVLGVKAVRTLVIDTISEAWELLQLAEFGKLKQNNKFAYGPLNAEFGGLIDECYYARPDLNTIYIQKVKKEYVDDKWDGKNMKPAGFGALDYLVDVNLTHFFREKQFGFQTEKAEATRFGAEFAGLEFVGEENSFTDLALHIFADDAVGSDPEYWGLKL